MSAWGKSWGVAFGVAWGAVLTPVDPPIAPPVVINSGGGVFGDQLFEVSEQINQEDEIIILAVAQCFAHGVFT